RPIVPRHRASPPRAFPGTTRLYAAPAQDLARHANTPGTLRFHPQCQALFVAVLAVAFRKGARPAPDPSDFERATALIRRLLPGQTRAWPRSQGTLRFIRKIS